MADILLSNTYFLRFDPKQESNMTPYPPLATLYAASVLRDEGMDIALFDTQFAEGAEDAFPQIKAHAGKLFMIVDDGFNYLTKMCLVNMREACFTMIRYAKEQGCTVAVSSSDATDHMDAYLKEGADYIIVGEAEQTIRELVVCLDAKQPTDGVSGLACSANGGMHKTLPRQVLTHLDSLPQPAWDLIDIQAYRSRWMQKHGYFSLNVATTRGCPFKCNWCAKPIYGNRYNAHSAHFIMDQIELHVKQHGATHIWFCDDIFGLKPGWIHAFREEAERRQLVFRFKIQCRADLLLNENNIADLAAAGCDEIWIGAESGSQMILDAMDKGTTIEQIRESTMLMKKHGIKPCFFLQFGYPGETRKEIRETIDLVTGLLPFDIGISVSYPLPGTVFYDRVQAGLKQKTNWTDSDELAMMFAGTYSPEYYKKLHRYVHRRFRKAQGAWYLKQVFKGEPTDLRRIMLWPYYAVRVMVDDQLVSD
ncbi:MAG TPA: radical SAM protein [Chitinophagales bacterium]|nr:radical SAM protein [Chitinophagales bacterium]